MNSKIVLLLAILTVSSTFAFFVVPANAESTATPLAQAPGESHTYDATSQFLVSPITDARYAIVTDPLLGETFRGPDGIVYRSVEAILDREALMFPDGAYKIEPSLRAADASGESDGRLSVVIFLASQFGSEISASVQDSYSAKLQTLWTRRQALFDKIMSTSLLGPLPADSGSIDTETSARFKSADNEYTSALTAMRREIYSNTRKLNIPAQDPVVAKIEELGGLVQYRAPFVNLITARICPAGLRELVKDDSVGSVYRNGILEAQLDISVPSIGAPDWWNAGYNTATYKLTVADTGIDKDHPDLSGKISDESVFHDEGKLAGNYNDDPADPDDLQGHGTHVAGIVASQHDTYRGTAYGLLGVVNAKFGWRTDTGFGQGTWGDAMKAIDWSIDTAGASVISFSFGESTNGNGNSGFTKFVDAVVDGLGVAYAAAAGNDGPNSNTVGIPADSYNALVVGAVDDFGTTSRADDSIADFSSRGPTGDGRLKPDIVAPGMDSSHSASNYGIMSCNYRWETQNDFIDYPGTSMATPHVGASSILLLNYLGTRGFFPAVPKALLLENAQDKGAVGPDNDYGYGYINLNATLTNRDKVYNYSVPYGTPRFYLGSWAGGDRATLVWQRHVTYKGSSYPTIFYNLNNLNVYLYNAPGNSQVASATSTINNVEQVRYSSPVASAVLKVKAMAALNGVSAENYALATLKSFTYAKPPTYQFIWSGASAAEVNTAFALTANVTNNGDLTGFAATGTLTVPPGVTLLAGPNPVNLGDIAPGATKSTTWTLRGDTVGDKNFSFAVTSNAYGEFFNATSNRLVRIMDNIPPVVNGVWSAPSPQNAGLKVNITADITDNLAVTAAYANVNGPTGFVGNFSMAEHPVSGLWFVDRPYFVRGNYDATVWGTDIDHWDSGTTSFVIVDTTPPTIVAHSALPNPQQIYGNVNITAQITDQAGVAGAWVEITDPSSGKTNHTMLSGPTSFWYDQQYDVLGTYGYDIWAVDPSNNWIPATGSFQIVDNVPPAVTALAAQPNPQIVFGTVNVSATITDVGGVVASYVEITDPVGGKTNMSLLVAGSTHWYQQAYGMLGTYSYRVSAVDIVNQWGVGTGTFRIIDPVVPVANAGPDATIPIGTNHTFDGSASSDNFGIISYTWTFLDQTPVSLNGPTPYYTFSRLGVFTVTLKVTDYANNNATDIVVITVRDYEKPLISNPSALPSPQNPGGNVQIRATITDNVQVADAWVNIWDPNSIFSNNTMTLIGGDDYAFTRTYFVVGIYTYSIWAADSSGNRNSTSGQFEVRDLLPPAILSVNAQPNPQEIFFPVDITAAIQDAVGVTGVWVEVRLPGGAVAGNYSMAYDAGKAAYAKSYLADTLGLYTFTVSARDAGNNWNTSDGQFLIVDSTSPTILSVNAVPNPQEVFYSVVISAVVQDTAGVTEVWIEITRPNGSLAGNFTMTYNSGEYTESYATDALGIHTFTVSATDVGGNWDDRTGQFIVRDTVPPTITPTAPNMASEVDVPFNLTATATDNFMVDGVWAEVRNSANGLIANLTMSPMSGPTGNRYVVINLTTVGDYQVRLWVSDFGGNWGKATVSVRISDSRRPIADAGPDQTVNASTLVTFDGSGSSDSHGIASYVWTFAENSALVTLMGPRPTHTFTRAGVYNVTLTVTDYGSNTDTDWVTITVLQSGDGNGNGNGNGNGGQKGLWDLIVNDLLIGKFGFLLILIIVIVAIVAAAVGRRRARKREQERRRAKARRLAQQRAAMESTPPPPPEDELAPPEDLLGPESEMPPPPPETDSPPPPEE